MNAFYVFNETSSSRFSFLGDTVEELTTWLAHKGMPGSFWVAPIHPGEPWLDTTADSATMIEVPTYEVWANVYGWSHTDLRVVRGTTTFEHAVDVLRGFSDWAPEPRKGDYYSHSWESRGGRSIITIEPVRPPVRV